MTSKGINRGSATHRHRERYESLGNPANVSSDTALTSPEYSSITARK